MEIVCPEEERALLGDLIDLCEPVVSPGAEFFLVFDAGILKLCRQGDRRGIWVECREIERRRTGSFLLGRACGLDGKKTPSLLDATAGFGLDGLALARKGAEVCLVEREPLLWALIRDLIRRLQAPHTELMLGDSAQLLERKCRFDVIYFDPMFPERRKSALPGKRMQYLAALLGEPRAFDQSLIPLAQSRARSRVVLKRRLKDPVALAPDWTLRGRSIRYDVYQGRG